MQVLTPADEIHHINKHNFKVPFVCGCRDLGEALRRVAEGAAMIRTKVGRAVGAAPPGQHSEQQRNSTRSAKKQYGLLRVNCVFGLDATYSRQQQPCSLQHQEPCMPAARKQHPCACLMMPSCFAAVYDTQGEAGTGNVVEAVRHARAVMGAIRQLQTLDEDELYVYSKEIRAPVELVRQTKHLGRLPVVNFAAGGVSTPADAALMMQLGMDGVFVGSGIFKSGDPAKRARAIVQAVTHYNNPKVLAEVSCDLGEPMVGIDVRDKNFNSYANRSE